MKSLRTTIELGRKKVCSLRFDFEKVYDCVDWNFLDKELEMKGFGYKWRMWMRGCLRYVYLL